MEEYYPDTAISSLQPEQKTRLVHDAKHQFNGKKLFDIAGEWLSSENQA
jgi:hypothetical protein